MVSVDHSVDPPSYAVQLAGGVRETESGRLLPAPPVVEEVQGLGHRDAATEAIEAAVRALEEP